MNGLPLVVLLATIGSRLSYLLVHPSTWPSPLDWLYFWNGGMVSYGGIAGTILGLYLIATRANIAPLRFLDRLAPCLLLGWAIGRLGCFLTWYGEEGTVTTLPWSVEVAGQTHHPTLLYVSCLVSLLGVYSWRQNGRPDGWVATFALFGYMLIRSLTDPFRLYHPSSLGSLSQLLSGGIAIVCLIHLIRSRRIPIDPVEVEE